MNGKGKRFGFFKQQQPSRLVVRLGELSFKKLRLEYVDFFRVAESTRPPRAKVGQL